MFYYSLKSNLWIFSVLKVKIASLISPQSFPIFSDVRELIRCALYSLIMMRILSFLIKRVFDLHESCKTDFTIVGHKRKWYSLSRKNVLETKSKMSLRRSSSAKNTAYAKARENLEKNLRMDDSDLRQSRSYTYEILLPEDTGGAREYSVGSLERSFSDSVWKFEQKSTRNSNRSRNSSRRSSRQTFGSSSSFGSQQRFIIDQFRVRFLWTLGLG